MKINCGGSGTQYHHKVLVCDIAKQKPDDIEEIAAEIVGYVLCLLAACASMYFNGT